MKLYPIRAVIMNNDRNDFEKIEADALLKAQNSESTFLWQCIQIVFGALAGYGFCVKEYLSSAPCYNNYFILLLGNFLAIILLWILNRISIISGYLFRLWQIVLSQIRRRHLLFKESNDGVLPPKWDLLCRINDGSEKLNMPEYHKFFRCFSCLGTLLIFLITFLLLTLRDFNNVILIILIFEIIIALALFLGNRCYYVERIEKLEKTYIKESNHKIHRSIVCRFFHMVWKICTYKHFLR